MENSFHGKTKVGQLLCGGFQGTSVTSQAYHLIVENHISTFILSGKNTASVKQISKLIKDLQYIARFEAKYEYPLMFAIDQEGGMMNSLFDKEYMTQFPGAMALAATGDVELVYELSKALAIELKHIGFQIILGPVLDVVTKLSHQLVGVRSFGTTIEEVTKFGKACARGLKDGGLLTVGKHFPGIGNANVDSLLELPMMTESIDQIKSYNSIPFAQLISDGLLDGISVSGCGVPSINPDDTHACLSPILINGLLRKEFNFKGFVISECLEMDTLYRSIGVGQGVILALHAGCDLVMLCHQKDLQDEALAALKLGYSTGNLDDETINNAFARIRTLQKQLPTWNDIFPKGEQSAKTDPIPFREMKPSLWKKHQQLSNIAYKKCITLIRDYTDVLPLTSFMNEEPNSNEKDTNNILILSPLLNTIYPYEKTNQKLYSGEEVFQRLGKVLAEHPKNINSNNPFNVFHTTYTANGLTAFHESLIENSKAVIVLTSEASRNIYQIGIVKFVSVLCGANNYNPNTPSQKNLTKPLIIIATSSPYDFFYNKSIGSAYLCCYDYTEIVLEQVGNFLMGDFQVEGCIPGEKKFTNKQRKRKMIDDDPSNVARSILKRPSNPFRRWLVDDFNLSRDWPGLLNILRPDKNGNTIAHTDSHSSAGRINFNNPEFFKKLYLLLHTSSDTQKHFVVRNSSLNILYGFVFTWVDENECLSLNGDLSGDDDNQSRTGSILFITVDKSKRFLSIGKNLHSRSIRYLVKERKCSKITLGSSLPLLLLPDDSNLLSSQSKTTSFAHSVGWELNSLSKKKHVMLLNDLSNWQVSPKMFRELTIVGVRFDICSNPENLMKLIELNGLYKPSDSEYYVDNMNTKRLYLEAIKYLSGNQAQGVRIITALEPTNQSIIGSIILFTNKSYLSKFFPFMDEGLESKSDPKDVDESESEELIGGLIGLLIDSSYSNLIEIINLGLVCSGITFLKSNFNEKDVVQMNKCMIFGVNANRAENFAGLKEIGFNEWKYYYDYYDVIEDTQSVLLD